SVGADVYYWQRWKTTQRTWHPRGATPFPNYAATDIYWHPLWMHRSNLGESIMQESALNTTKTGPIHLPRDGRPVHVDVRNLVKTFDKYEAVKGVSFTIGKGEIFGLLGP